MLKFRDLMFQNPLNEESVKFFNLCEKQFHDFLETISQAAAFDKCSPLIPKIIHLIWLGPRPYPEYAIENLKEWISLNPDYKFFLWTDNEQNQSFVLPKVEIKLIGKDFVFKFLKKEYEQNSLYAGKADVLRFELLYEYGGFYTDYDNRCCKNLDVFAYSTEFLSVFEFEKLPKLMPDPVTGEFIEPRLHIGVIGAKQNHPAFLNIFEKIKKAHSFFENYSPQIQMYQTVYATYIHFSLGFKDYVLKNISNFLVLPTYLAWYRYRGQPVIPEGFDPYFEISCLETVGWGGELYDFAHFKNQLTNL